MQTVTPKTEKEKERKPYLAIRKNEGENCPRNPQFRTSLSLPVPMKKGEFPTYLARVLRMLCVYFLRRLLSLGLTRQPSSVIFS